MRYLHRKRIYLIQVIQVNSFDERKVKLFPAQMHVLAE